MLSVLNVLLEGVELRPKLSKLTAHPWAVTGHGGTGDAEPAAAAWAATFCACSFARVGATDLVRTGAPVKDVSSRLC